MFTKPVGNLSLQTPVQTGNWILIILEARKLAPVQVSEMQFIWIPAQLRKS